MRALLLSLALVATPAFAQDATEPAAPAVSKTEATTLQTDDRLIGSADAPHEMVVYASVTCGHCGDWFTEEWPVVKSELVDTGQLRVAFRPFPTAPSQLSIPGFMLAGCGSEDAYWDHVVHQMQVQQQTFSAAQAGEAKEVIMDFGRRAGLDTEAEVEACFADDDVFAEIDLNMRRAEAAGLSGVPAFFFDGEEVGRAHDAEDIVALAAE